MHFTFRLTLPVETFVEDVKPQPQKKQGSLPQGRAPELNLVTGPVGDAIRWLSAQ